MPAWTQTASWTPGAYQEYRNYVRLMAPFYRWRREDCADLAMIIMINFAASRGLPLTFTDAYRGIYPSIGKEALFSNNVSRWFPEFYHWRTKEEFTEGVMKGLGVKALWKYNTTVNWFGPMPGDLLMKFTEGRYHHVALIFETYAPGQPHPKQNDLSVRDYPGDDLAEEQYSVTEYFRGTLKDDETTLSRLPDNDIHFDYLNPRGHKKPLAELIYFANARQFQKAGFEFRRYSPNALTGDDYWLPKR